VYKALGYNLKMQEQLSWQIYDQLRKFINANIDNYEKFETGIKNFLCNYLPTQQIFSIYKLFNDEYKRLKVIECIKFLEATNQLNGIKLIITNNDKYFFTFFTDRKIISKQK
jgi:hypothetical protein